MSTVMDHSCSLTGNYTDDDEPYRGVFISKRKLADMVKGTPEDALDCDPLVKVGMILRRKLYEHMK